MSPVSDPDSGRPPMQLPASVIAFDGPSRDRVDLATEVAALAALLADVVRLAGDSALFPSRWELIAELALEHDSVRAALRAEETGRTPALDTEHVIAQLNSLHHLIGEGHARC